MRRVSIACIVEGYGEVAAVPILLRRIVRELDHDIELSIPLPPIRVHRNKIIKEGELEKAVALAALKINGDGAILILLDADNDCPASLAPILVQRAKMARSDLPISVVLAKPEYEAWFLASAVSLRGKQGLSSTMEPHHDPESATGAKGWLRERMEDNRKYSETLDQPALTRHFNLKAAQQTSSFDKLVREISRLLSELNMNPNRESFY